MKMAESILATIQRRQIEITVGELLLTSDHYMRLEIAERLRHLIAHADPSLDLAQLSEGAREELEELDLLPKQGTRRPQVTHRSPGGAPVCVTVAQYIY